MPLTFLSLNRMSDVEFASKRSVNKLFSQLFTLQVIIHSKQVVETQAIKEACGLLLQCCFKEIYLCHLEARVLLPSLLGQVSPQLFEPVSVSLARFVWTTEEHKPVSSSSRWRKYGSVQNSSAEAPEALANGL